jgi:hypothetical protein
MYGSYLTQLDPSYLIDILNQSSFELSHLRCEHFYYLLSLCSLEPVSVLAIRF